VTGVQTCALPIWVNPEGIHLTLKFLGNISAEKTDEINVVMDDAAEKHQSFSIACRGLGTFPAKSRNPRIVWAGIEEHPELLDIQKNLDEQLAELGFSPEKRAFHPHLTLGRSREKKNSRLLIPEIEKFKEVEFGTIFVDKIILFESTLTPEGAVYSRIHESKLK
jgi:RNA 2',3'-cyclic 3'-phosphodiesterase